MMEFHNFRIDLSPAPLVEDPARRFYRSGEKQSAIEKFEKRKTKNEKRNSKFEIRNKYEIPIFK